MLDDSAASRLQQQFAMHLHCGSTIFRCAAARRQLWAHGRHDHLAIHAGAILMWTFLDGPVLACPLYMFGWRSDNEQASLGPAGCRHVQLITHPELHTAKHTSEWDHAMLPLTWQNACSNSAAAAAVHWLPPLSRLSAPGGLPFQRRTLPPVCPPPSLQTHTATWSCRCFNAYDDVRMLLLAIFLVLAEGTFGSRSSPFSA